ncbi:hypothetical protein WAI453_004934 [Rhynchosporium graminicola]
MDGETQVTLGLKNGPPAWYRRTEEYLMRPTEEGQMVVLGSPAVGTICKAYGDLVMVLYLSQIALFRLSIQVVAIFAVDNWVVLHMNEVPKTLCFRYIAGYQLRGLRGIIHAAFGRRG